jgi:hypothetical protein
LQDVTKIPFKPDLLFPRQQKDKAKQKKVGQAEVGGLVGVCTTVLGLLDKGTDYGCPMKPFSLKSRTFGLGQTNWADKFWGIWGIFSRTVSNCKHPFWYSESLVHVFHYSIIIFTKN